MQEHARIFGYVMIVYAFAFIAAITFDTDRALSGRDNQAHEVARAKTATMAGKDGISQANDTAPAVPAAAFAEHKI